MGGGRAGKPDMLQMLRQTFGLMFGHFLMALRVSVGPMVLGAVAIFALVTLLGLQDLIAVSNEGASPAEADPGAVLLASLATMLVMLIVGSWVAVAWHRFLLRGERTLILPNPLRRPVRIYALRLVAI